ncbi:MAG: hypothetical protein AAFN74_19110 [Myxococcota bacterium]
MTKLGVTIPQPILNALEKRAQKLTSLVDVATSTATDKKVRDNGAQLIERVNEWVEEIRDLNMVGDDEVEERAKSFHIRLKLAEDKIKGWALPASVRDKAEAALRPRRRGRPRKKPVAA